MKSVLLSILLTVPSTVMGDAGVSVSYRSTPVIVEKNWLNDSKWPAEAAFYDGITTYRTLNMMTINLYFDDSLKAHDKNKVAGKYTTKYYISEFEPPSKEYPVGRMVEREVDIGDATPEEINTRNAWKEGNKRVPKVYAKQVYVKSRIKGWLPGWLNPNKGAGYIFGLNFNYAAEKDLVEFYSWDAYIGKRIFLLPHLLHVYFKIGPSYARYNYDFVDRYLFTESKIGGFYNIGFQALVLKGIKIFTEIEFRSYGAAPMPESFNLEKSNVEFVNTLPPFSSNYNDAKFSKEWLKDLVSQGIRFGLKFNF